MVSHPGIWASPNTGAQVLGSNGLGNALSDMVSKSSSKAGSTSDDAALALGLGGLRVARGACLASRLPLAPDYSRR